MLYELKTVLPSKRTDEIINYLNENSTKSHHESQVIYDYHTEGNFRLLRDKDYVLLDFRPNSSIEKENSVYIAKKYEQDLIQIFTKIGLFLDYKRFRTRDRYIYNDLFITIDKYVKTGNILRVKFHYNNEEEKTIKENNLKEFFEILKIEETSTEKFDELFGKYRSDWVRLTEGIDEEEFLKG